MSRWAKLRNGVFLTLSVLPVILELVQAFDRDDDTWPWTEMIVRYVPWELALAVYAALAAWVPVHFFVRYRRKHRGQS